MCCSSILEPGPSASVNRSSSTSLKEGMLIHTDRRSGPCRLIYESWPKGKTFFFRYFPKNSDRRSLITVRQLAMCPAENHRLTALLNKGTCGIARELPRVQMLEGASGCLSLLPFQSCQPGDGLWAVQFHDGSPRVAVSLLGRDPEDTSLKCLTAIYATRRGKDWGKVEDLGGKHPPVRMCVASPDSLQSSSVLCAVEATGPMVWPEVKSNTISN